MSIAGSMLAGLMTPHNTDDDLSTDQPDPDSLTLLSNETIVRDENLAKVEIAVLTAMFVLSFAGNGIVILALISLARRRKLSRMNTMIGHLAIADLFVALCSVLPQLIWKINFRFQGGNMLCKLVRYVQMVTLYSSSYVLLTTAIDRYIAICHPLRMHAWTQRRMHGLVLVAWFLSFALASPQLFIFAYNVVDPLGTFDCIIVIYFPWSRRAYVTFFAAAVYLVPLCVLVFLYLRICMAVWRRDSPSARLRSSLCSTSAHSTASYHQKGAGAGGGAGGVACRSESEPRVGGAATAAASSSGTGVVLANGGARVERRRRGRRRRRGLVQTRQQLLTSSTSGCSTTLVQHHHPKDGISIAKLKTVKLTALVVGCYFVCQGPFFVSHVWAAWDANAPFEGKAMAIILLLASLNSCSNPWIYFAFNDQFSRIFTSISSRRKRPLGRQPSPSTYSTDKDNTRIQLHHQSSYQQQQHLPLQSQTHRSVVGTEKGKEASPSTDSEQCRYSRM